MEFGFELALAAQIESDESVLSRQFGASVHDRRVIDLVRVEPGPEFDRRVALTAETIPPAAIESDVGPGRARYWKEAFDCHPERAERAVEQAVDSGFFERERRNGRTVVRQAERYPDWLPVDEPGVEICDRSGGRTDIQVASVEAKHRARTALAERAYGKGWRTYEMPACARVDPDEHGLPYYPWKGRLVRPATECGPACDGHDPADPPEVDFDSLRAASTPRSVRSCSRQSGRTSTDTKSPPTRPPARPCGWST